LENTTINSFKKISTNTSIRKRQTNEKI